MARFEELPGNGLREQAPLVISDLRCLPSICCETGHMKPRFKRSDLVVPPSTYAVLLPSSAQPSFARNSTRFRRAAFVPARRSLVTERLDLNDAPNIYNYNEYSASVTSSGTFLSGPCATPSTFIPHHQATPSTWLDGLPHMPTS